MSFVSGFSLVEAHLRVVVAAKIANILNELILILVKV